MDQHTRQRLLALNRDFYTVAAEPFNRSRGGWWPGLLRILPYIPTGTKELPARVVDVGCGNGRYAHILESRGTPVHYTGVDGSAELLARARVQCASLAHVRARFLQADLVDPDWPAVLGENPTFDAVLCLATLHHLPGYSLRLETVRRLATLLDPSRPAAVLILSAWQFLSSSRLAGKRLDWGIIGLSPQDVELGDALLPWRQGVEAVRYAHQIDAGEMGQLAWDAGLTIIETFRSDGRQGDLNLYAVLSKADSSCPCSTDYRTNL